MKILVTGGSGYLGTHVRRFFNADDFSRRSYLNITDARDLKTVANYDVVIHLAAHLDKNPDAAALCFSTNADATMNLIQNMKPGAVLIYASTKDVYGANADSYDEVPKAVRRLLRPVGARMVEALVNGMSTTTRHNKKCGPASFVSVCATNDRKRVWFRNELCGIGEAWL